MADTGSISYCIIVDASGVLEFAPAEMAWYPIKGQRVRFERTNSGRVEYQNEFFKAPTDGFPNGAYLPMTFELAESLVESCFVHLESWVYVQDDPCSFRHGGESSQT